MSPKLGKKKRREIAETEAKSRISVILPPEPPNAPPQESSFWKGANRIYIIGGIVIVVLTIILFKWACSDRNKTPKEKIADLFDSGTLHPDPLTIQSQSYEPIDKPFFSTIPPVDSINAPKIVGILLDSVTLNSRALFKVGRLLTSIESKRLETGIEFHFPRHNPYNNTIDPACERSNLRVGVHNSRLYVSCEFHDLSKDEFIGKIEYNHWTVYIPNLLCFDNDDKRLEVRDKQNKIVLSVNYVPAGKVDDVPAVVIGGYFMSSNAVIVLPNDSSKSLVDCYCYLKSDPDYKTRASETIDSLVTAFPEKVPSKP